MDIEEIKKAKEELEVEIENILRAFEKKTQTKIDDIKIVQRSLVLGEIRSTISGVRIDVRL